MHHSNSETPVRRLAGNEQARNRNACLVGNAQGSFTVMTDADAKDFSSQWFVFYLLCVSTRDEMLIVFLPRDFRGEREIPGSVTPVDHRMPGCRL